MIITIDGESGTGKSTVSKILAERIGFTYFDTGALYRSIAWKFLKDKVDLQDEKAIHTSLKQFQFNIESHSLKKRYFVDGIDVTKAIRSSEVTSIVSEISAIKAVREALTWLKGCRGSF